jgi:hypothetical protein
VRTRAQVSGRLTNGRVLTPRAIHESHVRLSSRAWLRFWRWVTCGHGRHPWHLHAGMDLALDPFPVPVMVVARHCPRCDTTEVLE